MRKHACKWYHFSGTRTTYLCHEKRKKPRDMSRDKETK